MRIELLIKIRCDQWAIGLATTRRGGSFWSDFESEGCGLRHPYLPLLITTTSSATKHDGLIIPHSLGARYSSVRKQWERHELGLCSLTQIFCAQNPFHNLIVCVFEHKLDDPMLPTMVPNFSLHKHKHKGMFEIRNEYIGHVLKTQTRFVSINTNTNQKFVFVSLFGSEITDTTTTLSSING
jgi:hypothetical protein